MLPYLIRRLFIFVPIMFGVTLMTFFIAHLMPGDYVDALTPIDITLAGPSPASEALRQYYGLDKPLPEQYLIWLRELLHGNLGTSYATGTPVLQEIGKRLPATLELTITAMLISILGGTTLGIFSAIKQYSWLDHTLTLVGLVWLSTPSFVLALLSLYLFYLKFPLFPLGGEGPIGEAFGLGTRLHHLVLPALIMAMESLARFMRYMRSSLLDVIDRQEYIVVARAKGLAERVVILRHALRNSLMPMITIVGLSLPALFSSAFIIETIFQWPGLGRYGILAINRRDYPVILAMNLILALLVLLTNLMADIAYAVADPRVRYQ